MIYISKDRKHYDKIKKLYKDGFSANEIVSILKLSITPRTIQRWLKADNLNRTKENAFRLAVRRGVVTYHKKPLASLKQRKTVNNALRYKIFSQYGFKCVLCGATSKDDRLQIDHINENPFDNSEENLQVLCEACNKGKYLNS